MRQPPDIGLRKAVFLDRDGVLIRSDVAGGKPFAVGNQEHVQILDGVKAACGALSEAGFALVMVTNQPDVARGKTARSFVEATNNRLKAELGLDAAEACLHDDSDNCDCRKPKSGMLLQAAARLSIDLTSSIMVGDRWRDIEAGRNAGCKTVFIDCGYDEPLTIPPDFTASSLNSAVPWILAQKR